MPVTSVNPVRPVELDNPVGGVSLHAHKKGMGTRVTLLQAAVLLLSASCFRATYSEEILVSCTTNEDCLEDNVCVNGLCAPSSSTCILMIDGAAIATPDGGACGKDGTDICLNARCVQPTCGDLILTPSLETCDGQPDCRTDCTRCGDGVLDVQHGETCDEGNANSDVEPGACRTSCVVASCGDGVRDPGEGCDRGAANSATEPDACRPNCALSGCGDAVLDDGELCDDGPANSDSERDACRTTCAPATCGDGTLDDGEACDDGRGNSDVQPGTCRTNCMSPRCGDGTLDVNEQCDDGEQNSDTTPGACRTTCERPTCGDGITDPTELCDQGAANSDSAVDACRVDCRPARCGDGVLDSGESCDDGGANSDVLPGACRATCVSPICGDGIRDPGEDCDQGVLNSNSRADACRLDCRLSRCGDGVIDSLEACDDGAGNSDVVAGACRSTCDRAGCGDGVIDVGEACDDGANNSDVVPGACRSRCVLPTCGDGVRDPGEACDRGVLNSDTEANACRTTCALSNCGDGIEDVTEECDNGITNSNDIANACRLTCLLPRCGDGVVDTGEVCDDGAANSDVRPGACRTTCQPSDCGDGALDTDEECDDGDENSDTAANACRSDCRRARCGDAVLDASEVCDDGGAPDGDCRGDCAKIEVCGDAVVDQGEACDDGNANPYDGCDACLRMRWESSVLIGPGFAPRAAETTSLSGPSGLAIGVDDTLYITDLYGHRVRRVDSGGLTTIAGSGSTLVSGDEGPASVAGVPAPFRVAVDGTGRVAVVDSINHRVRVIGRDGIIRRVAGTGAAASSGDGNGAVLAGVYRPNDVAYDGLGNLYIAETYGRRVRKVDTAGIITTVFGNGNPGRTGDGLPGPQATVTPYGLAADRLRGRLYVLDSAYHVVRMLDENGIARTVVGIGVAGYTGDGGPAAQAQLNTPSGVAVARDGTLYVTDAGNHVVRKVDTNGIITTIAGTGVSGFSGNGGPAKSAQVYTPSGIAVDSLGRVFFADFNNRMVRRIDLDGTIHTVAGTGVFGDVTTGAYALSANLYYAGDTQFDSQGRLLVTDILNARVVRVEHDGTLKVIAGSTAGVFAHEGRGVLEATFGSVPGIAMDSRGRIHLADQFSHRVLRFEEDGVVVTVAGTGVAGFTGDGGPATQARLNGPYNVEFDALDRMYIIDLNNARIRRIDEQGIITTVAGSGTAGFAGDNGPATSARINQPWDVDAQPDGSFIVTDTLNHRVRHVGTDGVIRTIAGTGANLNSADGGLATASAVASPTSVGMDAAGRVVFAEYGTARIRRIETDGTLTTLAGAGLPSGYAGDGGPGKTAKVAGPRGLSLRSDGTMAWIDYLNNRVRMLDPSGRISTVIGLVHPEMIGTDARGRVIGARQAMELADGRLVIAGGGSARLAVVDIDERRVQTILGYDAAYAPNGGDVAPFFLFGAPSGIAGTPSGLLYVADPNGSRLIEVDALDPDPSRWNAQTLAVDGLLKPYGLLWEDASGTLLVADAGDHCVRRVSPETGTTDILLGRCGFLGTSSEGTTPANARLNGPEHFLLAPDGALYVSDTQNNRVLMVRGGTVTTVLGTGAPSSTGTGTARQQSVELPRGLAMDRHGNLYVASRQAVRVVANVDGDTFPSGDDLAFTAYEFNDDTGGAACLTELMLRDDELVVFDACSGSVRALRASQIR